jgi:hypothetical protein
MEENVKRLALSKRPQLALFFRPVSRFAMKQKQDLPFGN